MQVGALTKEVHLHFVPSLVFRSAYVHGLVQITNDPSEAAPAPTPVEGGCPSSSSFVYTFFLGALLALISAGFSDRGLTPGACC